MVVCFYGSSIVTEKDPDIKHCSVPVYETFQPYFADKTQPLPGTYLSNTPARIGPPLACRVGWNQSGFGKAVPDVLSAWGCSTCQCDAAACWSHGAAWTYWCPQPAGNLQRHVNMQREESVSWKVNTDINIIRGPVLPFPSSTEHAGCLGLTSSWLRRDLWTKTSLSTCHFHRDCKDSTKWWKQLQKEKVAMGEKLNVPKESWASSFLWHWLSATLGLAVTSLPVQSVDF